MRSDWKMLFKTARAAFVLLALASLAAGEKKIELQDIEDDNLKSELAKVQSVEFEDTDVGRFLKPPPQQPATFDQPRQPDFSKTQYQVQDTQPDDFSNRDYLSSPLYALQAPQEISQRDIGPGNFLGSGPGQNYLSLQNAMFGYAQPLAMHLLYFPQYTAASNAVPTYANDPETHPKVDIQTYSSPQLDNGIYQQQALAAGIAQQYSDYAAQQQSPQSYAPQETGQSYAQQHTAQSYAQQQEAQSYAQQQEAQSYAQQQEAQSYAQQQEAQSYAQQQAVQDYVQQQSAKSYPPQIAYISVPSHATQNSQLNLQKNNVYIGSDYQTQYGPNSLDTNSSPKFATKYEPTSKPTVIYPKPILPGGAIKYKKPTYQYVTPTPTVQTLQSPHPQRQITQAIPTPSSLVYETHYSGNAHVPRVLSHHGHPVSRPVYSHIAGNLPQSPNRLPHHDSLQNFIYVPKRKPTSLIDSYIPSSIQVEYLKRGLSKDPLSTYDTIAYSNRIHPGVKAYFPRAYERGFLPNQMIHTASGGVGFAQLKRGLKAGKTV